MYVYKFWMAYRALSYCFLRRTLHKSVLSKMVATIPCGYWILEMWLAQTEMCYKYKVHTGVQNFSMKYTKYLKMHSWLCVETIIFGSLG